MSSLSSASKDSKLPKSELKSLAISKFHSRATDSSKAAEVVVGVEVRLVVDVDVVNFW